MFFSIGMEDSSQLAAGFFNPRFVNYKPALLKPLIFFFSDAFGRVPTNVLYFSDLAIPSLGPRIGGGILTFPNLACHE